LQKKLVSGIKVTLLLIGMLTLAFNIQTVRAEGYTNVTVSEARSMIDSNPSLTVLDVRTQSEYDSGHIKNAKLIPVTELEERLDELSKTDEILVYCRSGVRSQTASQILVDNGFLHVYNMLGGISAWISEGCPYVKCACSSDLSIVMLSGSELKKAVSRALSDEKTKKLRATLVGSGYTPQINNATAMVVEIVLDAESEVLPATVVSIPFNEGATIVFARAQDITIAKAITFQTTATELLITTYNLDQQGTIQTRSKAHKICEAIVYGICETAGGLLCVLECAGLCLGFVVFPWVYTLCVAVCTAVCWKITPGPDCMEVARYWCEKIVGSSGGGRGKYFAD